VGAGARLALGARRVPVREGLLRKAPRVSAPGERVPVDVAVGVLINERDEFC